MKKWFALLSVLVVLSVLVTACGGGATPTQAPAAQATEAPAATTAPEATSAPAPTTAPEPTAAPAATGGEGEVVLWHGWTGAEADKLTEVIAAFQTANPGVTVAPLAVPFDQLKNKFTTEASTGGGPDLLIGPKDWIGARRDGGRGGPHGPQPERGGCGEVPG